MQAPRIYSIISWRGTTVPRWRMDSSYVYLLHFSEKYPNGRKPQHYLGSTTDLNHRISVHKSGNAARLTTVVRGVGIDFEICRLWRCDSYEEAKNLERALKRKHGPGRLCPYCTGKPVDVLTSMRQGHWPFELFERPGRRQPMTHTPRPVFVRRMKQSL